MSILNRPADGVYSVLIAIYKCLLVFKQLAREDLLRIICPESLTDKNTEAGALKTLNRWIQLGLFQKNENDTVEISPRYQSKKGKVDLKEALSELPMIARKIVFLEENNENFWEKEENRSADFTRALSWILAQDIYNIPSKSYNTIAPIEEKQFVNAHERRPFQNDTRWNGFKAWATYLGFAWTSDTFQIDPTVSIRDNLPLIFKSEKKLPQDKFFSRLRELLPVVDGGKYREKVEQELLTSQWKKPKDSELSTSLSFALWRLQIMGQIKLEYRADAPSKVSLIGNNRILGEISDVKIN